MFTLPSHIDRYEIKSLIGRGGMGDLYLARDTNPNTNRLVALKLLNATLDSGDLRARFARESRALAALNHPNIVYIYDSGEFEGSPFIVMEYVRGETLAEKIKRKAPMSTAQKLKLMVELCAGLAHAHEAGIIHRDIKPANLMVDHQGRLKILDFGIARVAEGSFTRAGLQMTQVNVRIGTPGYMSPEQIEGGEVDQRSDLFAVGTVCYELLSYREAFTGSSTRQIENQVLQVQPAPLASLVPGLDPEIDEIVTRALEKDPDKRYQDAATLEEAFESQRSRLRPSDTPAPTVRATPPPQKPGRQSRDSRADAAYQRAMAVYQEGAREAARRFVIEALAEDPDHGGARALLERLEPNRRTPPPPTSVPPRTPALPTVLKTRTDDPPAPAPWKRRGPPWNRYLPLWKGRAAPLVALLVTAAVVVMVVIGLAGLFWPQSQLLTVDRPSGGSISSKGIKCGTLGSDCSAGLANGDAVELEVQADPGFLFVGYTGDCAPGGRTLMTAPRRCGARFDKIPATPAQVSHVLTITPLPKGGTILSERITCGTMGADCSHEYPDGFSVTLIAKADPGYAKLGFTGDCDAQSGQTLMTASRTCGATFVPTPGRPIHLPPPNSAGSGPDVPRPGPRPPPEAPVPPPPPIDRNAGGPGSNPPEGTPGASPSPGSSRPPSTAPLGPSAPFAPPPITPEAFAKTQIEKVLKEDRSAFENRDADELRRVYPNAPVTQLKRQFSDIKSLTCTTSPPEYVQLDPNPSAGSATVKVDVKRVDDLKVGAPQKYETTHTMKLSSRPDPRGQWFIDSENVKPKQ